MIETVAKKDLDRILVKKNAKMQQIIDWYLKNQDTLESGSFFIPFSGAYLVFEEEQLGLAFRVHSPSEVYMTLYVLKTSDWVVSFCYDPMKDIITEKQWTKSLPEKRQLLLKILLDSYDRTCEKNAFKFRVLMFYAVYYKQEIPVDETKRKRLNRHSKRTIQHTLQETPLVRNTYVLDPKQESLKAPIQKEKKHSYRKPEHEVKVRGYRRANGTWVKPYSRYKDKGSNGPKTYKT